MAITSLLDSSLPETVISEDKSQEIIELIKERFTETDHAPVAKQKDALLDGDRSSDSHILSRKMMQVYIASFWNNFHSQLPIRKYYFIDSCLHISTTLQSVYFIYVLDLSFKAPWLLVLATRKYRMFLIHMSLILSNAK
jgi:hypothetical protein